MSLVRIQVTLIKKGTARVCGIPLCCRPRSCSVFIMAEFGQPSCSDKSLPCYSLDKQLLRILWGQGIGMNELLEVSSDRADRLAETCGVEVSVTPKQELWSYVKRMQLEKADRLSSTEVPADRPRTSGSFNDSIGPPPPSPEFWFANGSPLKSPPRSSSPVAREVTSPGAGSPTSRFNVLRDGQGHTSRSRQSMPSLPDLSPIVAPRTRSSKRPIGMRGRSLFPGAVSTNALPGGTSSQN